MLGKFGASLAVIVIVTACAQDGSSPAGGQKETIGTILGGITGGLIGTQVGHGTGKVLAVGTGAVVGALVGNYIGSKLDEHDKVAAAAAANKALSSSNAKPVAWNNPQSGNSGTVVAKPVRYVKRPSSTTGAAAPPALVPPPAQLASVEPMWVSSSTTNIRSAPNLKAPPLGKLRPNRNFAVLGQVPDSDWLVVGDGGQAVGYVNKKVVKPAIAPPATALASAGKTGTAPSPGPAAAASAVPTQPAGGASSDTGSSAPVPAAGTGSATTQAVLDSGDSNAPRLLADPNAIDRSIGRRSGESEQVACRTTVSTVRLKGQDQPQVTEATFCRQPDGTWAPTSS